MRFLPKIINSLLTICATGRIPKPGKLFRISTWAIDVLTIHEFPNNGNSPYNCQKFTVIPGKGGTLLVLEVQEGVPLWDLWIKVLYCSNRDQSIDDIAIGWIAYPDFSQIVLTEWDKWEEEKN